MVASSNLVIPTFSPNTLINNKLQNTGSQLETNASKGTKRTDPGITPGSVAFNESDIMKNNLLPGQAINMRQDRIYGMSVYTANGDLTKRWFIRIKVPDFLNGSWKHKKCYGDINKFFDEAGRMKEINTLVEHLNNVQVYDPIRGSRFKRLPIPLHHLTDVVYQLRIQLEIRKPSICLTTYRKYFTMIHNIQEWLTSQNRSNLTVGAFTNMDAKMFMHYLQSKKQYSHSSYNGHLIGLRSFYDEIVLQGMSSTNPFLGIKMLAKNYTASLYYQPGQVQILKRTISDQDPELWQFIKFIFYCFIRPGELRQLKLSDIYFSENKILIRKDISKNKKSQYVSIPAIFLSEMYANGWHQLPGDYFVFSKTGMPGIEQIPLNAMRTRHQKILKDLNFNTLRHKLYSWKHTGAVQFVKNGGSLKDLQMQLRHHSLDQVDAYLKDLGVGDSAYIINMPGI